MTMSTRAAASLEATKTLQMVMQYGVTPTLEETVDLLKLSKIVEPTLAVPTWQQLVLLLLVTVAEEGSS